MSDEQNLSGKKLASIVHHLTRATSLLIFHTGKMFRAFESGHMETLGRSLCIIKENKSRCLSKTVPALLVLLKVDKTHESVKQFSTDSQGRILAGQENFICNLNLEELHTKKAPFVGTIRW